MKKLLVLVAMLSLGAFCYAADPAPAADSCQKKETCKEMACCKEAKEKGEKCAKCCKEMPACCKEAKEKGVACEKCKGAAKK